MIQYIIIGLAILCALAGLVTVSTGKLSLTGSSQMKGNSARIAGVVLLVLGVAMAAFALYILPGMMR